MNFGVEIEEKLESFVGDRLDSLRKECHQAFPKGRRLLDAFRMRGYRRRMRRRACRRTWRCSSGS